MEIVIARSWFSLGLSYLCVLWAKSWLTFVPGYLFKDVWYINSLERQYHPPEQGAGMLSAHILVSLNSWSPVCRISQDYSAQEAGPNATAVVRSKLSSSLIRSLVSSQSTYKTVPGCLTRLQEGKSLRPFTVLDSIKSLRVQAFIHFDKVIRKSSSWMCLKITQVFVCSLENKWNHVDFSRGWGKWWPYFRGTVGHLSVGHGRGLVTCQMRTTR